MTWPNDPRHIPARSDFVGTDASVRGMADPSSVLPRPAHPAANTISTSANAITDMGRFIWGFSSHLCRCGRGCMGIRVGGYVPMTFRSPRARNDAGPRSKAATATRPMRLLHARAMRGGENAVQIRRALVRQALADVRHRRARADAARLLPRLLRLLHAAELAEEHGPVGVRGNEVGILLHELGEGVQRLLPLLRQEIRMAERPQIEEGIVRIQPHGMTDEPDALLGSARPAQDLGQRLVGGGVVRSELDGPLGLGDGALVLLLPQRRLCQQAVAIRQRVVERNRPLGKIASLFELSIRTPEELPALQMRPAETDVGGGIARIEGGRLREQPPRLGVALARRALALLVAAQRQVVGLEHRGRRPSDANLLRLRNLDGQRAHDLLRDLILKVEDVTHFTVVPLA